MSDGAFILAAGEKSVAAHPCIFRPRNVVGVGARCLWEGWVVPERIPVAGAHGWAETTVRTEESRSRLALGKDEGGRIKVEWEKELANPLTLAGP